MQELLGLSHGGMPPPPEDLLPPSQEGMHPSPGEMLEPPQEADLDMVAKYSPPGDCVGGTLQRPASNGGQRSTTCHCCIVWSPALTWQVCQQTECARAAPHGARAHYSAPEDAPPTDGYRRKRRHEGNIINIVHEPFKLCVAAHCVDVSSPVVLSRWL